LEGAIMYEVKFRINPKNKWITINHGHYDKKINDKLQFIRDLLVNTDLDMIEIKIHAEAGKPQ